MKTALFARALVIENNQMLVDERGKGQRLFGGRVEKDEHAAEALQREIEEELGVQVTILGVAFVTERFRKPRGKRARRVIEIVYQCTVSGALAPVGKHFPRWVPVTVDVKMATAAAAQSN